MNKPLLVLMAVLIAISLINCNDQNQTSSKTVEIIPQPKAITLNDGQFTINAATKLFVDVENDEVKQIASLLVEQIKSSSGLELTMIENEKIEREKNFIAFQLLEEKRNDEAYQLIVDDKSILVNASKPAGLFYGLQTLLQLFPPEIYTENTLSKEELVIPALEIKDEPRFSYRGMHLDVSRHFFPKEFIKKYIDLIAFHKMNTFHWHLVDDQGWRIEIKKYPKLTEIGAWRVDREDKIWGNRPEATQGEEATYGGFYTQEDIKEIVEYARKKYVTIIPEIEMPAHVMSAIAAYPELACNGENINVPTGGVWPITKIYCAGNDNTFTFLENVLTEVMELFPSEYIHVGGDEATKTAWEGCPKCQARIKNEQLENVEELQSYFITRIEKFLNANNRKLVGWDEILEGGLAPEATVMSWRGEQGGIAAAKSSHFAIMTPGSHCYFDHYQGDPDMEPVAIGGYTSLRKVYSYEPVPEELNEQEARYILGAQANLWTEYVYDGKHAEYMIVPRMAALAEVVWSPKENKDWDNFNTRLQTQFQRYDYLEVNYCEGTTKLDIQPEFKDSVILISISTERYQPEVRYTVDGSEPTKNSTLYEEPFSIEGFEEIKAALFDNGKMVGKVTTRKIGIHKAFGKKVSYLVNYSTKYAANGENALIDGMTGSKAFNDGFWQGFDGKDVEVIIDFGKPMDVTKVSAGFLQAEKSWIFLPKSIEFLSSDDNANYSVIAEINNDIPTDSSGVVIKRFEYQDEKQSFQYLKVKVNALKICPDWHGGAGKDAWTFMDEIIVE